MVEAIDWIIAGLFALIIILGIVGIVNACSNEKARKRMIYGRVLSKSYSPSRTYTRLMLVGKIMMPQIVYVSERYSIFVDGFDKDDKPVSATWSVDSKTYESLKIEQEVRVIDGRLNW